ncbi:MAG: FkbM family methyltransferase [Nanoarchaeota archaeon]
MNKLQSFIKLKGNSFLDNVSVQKEKLKYLFCRLIEKLILKKDRFSMGDTLMKPTIIDNGYGLFLCKEKCLDLHIVSGSYEFETGKVFEKIAKKSKVIVDVGAHIGKYTILASKVNPNAEVFPIEVDKKNFITLNKNISLNNLKNVYPIRVGLSNRKGREKFNNWLREGFEIVKTDTLDNLFKNKEIDLIKIDVDGSEFNILKGGINLFSKKRIKNVIIEINDNCYKEVIQFFKKYGYKLIKIQYENYLATF